MLETFFSYFFDSILRAPTIGCSLMCLTTALIGVLAYVQKKSLFGEALSHGAYPGIVIGVLLLAKFFPEGGKYFFLLVIGSAFLSCLVTFFCVEIMVKKFCVTNDAALCFVLSTLFGVGVVFASRCQMLFPKWYKQMQLYLYGQAATMTDFHIFIYATFAVAIILFIFFFWRQLEALYFDKEFSCLVGIATKMMQSVVLFFLVLAIVVGMRVVGIVLISGMLVAPSIAARQFTDKLSIMFILAALFAAASGVLGNIFSGEISYYLVSCMGGKRVSLPIGPVIILMATMFAIVSLFFAPKRGLFFRFLRICKFRSISMQENILKSLVKNSLNEKISLSNLCSYHHISVVFLFFLLLRMKKNGYVKRKFFFNFSLTRDGKKKALRIAHLHHLWEIYLSECMGIKGDKVHHNAEEMEHILSYELEEKLNNLLKKNKKYVGKDVYLFE